MQIVISPIRIRYPAAGGSLFALSAAAYAAISAAPVR